MTRRGRRTNPHFPGEVPKCSLGYANEAGGSGGVIVIRLLSAICVVFLCGPRVLPQTAGPAPPASSPSGAASKVKDLVFNYLTRAGTPQAAGFRPLTQQERNRLFLKSTANPIWFLKAAASGGIAQWNQRPPEWELGASGYGKRCANIAGRYMLQRTATFGVSSLLHEDNRYFSSGKKGFFRRTGYALSSAVLARRDDGKRRISVSSIAGSASGAFVSRLWQPSSTRSAGDGAVSFGISMGSSAAFRVVREFLPDMLRPLLKRAPPRKP